MILKMLLFLNDDDDDHIDPDWTTNVPVAKNIHNFSCANPGTSFKWNWMATIEVRIWRTTKKTDFLILIGYDDDHQLRSFFFLLFTIHKGPTFIVLFLF